MSTHVHHRQCTRCSRKYEILEHQRFNGDGYDPPTFTALAKGAPEDWTRCPKCGWEEYRDVVGTPALMRIEDNPTPYLMRAPDIHENQLSDSHFPYYDHGLGMQLHSVEHREWAKTHYKDGQLREEPLVWCGDELPWKPTDIVDQQIAHTREVEEKYKAYKAEMMADPETRKAWNWVEMATANQDFTALGAGDDFFGPQDFPPDGEVLKQDDTGHLFTDSGWASEHPQPWVPTALAAAGLPPLLPGDRGPHLIEASDAATAG